MTRIYTDFLAIFFNVFANIRVISVIRVLSFSSKRLQEIFQTHFQKNARTSALPKCKVRSAVASLRPL